LSSIGSGAETCASATATLGTCASAIVVVGTGASASVSGDFINSKKMRFSLESLNELILSQNAKRALESCHFPNINNLTKNVVYVLSCASSQDTTYDTTKTLNGNPILVSNIIINTSISSNIIFNATDFFII
jgi:hypothetical protein